MFNSLRKLFGKRVETTVKTTGERRTPTPPSLTLAPGFTPRSARVDTQPRPAAPAGPVPTVLTIPLKSILSRLPPDLMQRVRQLDVGEAAVSVSMQKVLSQIAQGAVKLSFGELRQVAPPGTFTAESDLDRSLVDLPLHEVIARMNLALLPRRPVQKHVEVPPEVTGPFGGQCKVAISNSTNSPKPAPPAQPPSRIQAPPQSPQRFQPPVAPVQPAQRSQPVARIRNAPPVESSPSSDPLLDVQEPAFNPPLNRNGSATPPPLPQPVVHTPIAPEPAPAPTVQPAAIPMSDTFRKASPAAPITPIAPVKEPEPAPIRFSLPAQDPAPAPAPAPQPAVVIETRFLTVSLSELSQSWPEAVKEEIISLKAASSTLSLPLGAVEVALKYGKVAFPWKALRSWIKPSVSASLSASDGVVLELPLKVVAPLFLAEMKSGKPVAKVSIDKEIPDLFFDGTRPADAAGNPPAASVAVSAPAASKAPVPQAAPVTAPAASAAPVFVAVPPAPPAPAPTLPFVPSKPPVATVPPVPGKSSDTNFFSRGEKVVEAEDQPVFLKKDGTPGTAFLKRYATPNEIVTKAASLNGVDGALIALPDGLLVASRIPATMNADTVAAFLPQIFGKVSQCTRELRLGDLNNLNFTVGNVPWKIFKVGAIYFAAFGRTGEAMPTAQLAGLAAELDHKAK